MGEQKGKALSASKTVDACVECVEGCTLLAAALANLSEAELTAKERGTPGQVLASQGQQSWCRDDPLQSIQAV